MDGTTPPAGPGGAAHAPRRRWAAALGGVGLLFLAVPWPAAAQAVPEVSFAVSASAHDENDGTVQVDVNLDTTPDAALTLNYIVRGTAATGADGDFTIQGNGALQIASGERSATIDVTIIDDALAEDAETIVLTLTAGSNYTTASGAARHTLTIRASDPPGVRVSPISLELTEGGAETEQYRVLLAARPANTVTVTATPSVPFKVVLSEQGGTPGPTLTLTFTPNNWDFARTVIVTPYAADLDSNDDSISIWHTVTGLPAHISAAEVSVTVRDAADPEIRFATASSRWREADGTVGARCADNPHAIALSSEPDSDLTLRYQVSGTATPGADYRIDGLDAASMSGTVDAPAGEDCVPLPIIIVNDNEPEGAETIILTLVAGDGYQLDDRLTAHTLTLDDGTGGVRVSTADIDLREGGSGSYTVVLTTEPDDAVTVTATVTGSNASAVAIAGPGGTVGGSVTLRFTPETWNLRQTVTVTASEDADGSDDIATIEHTAAGYGAIPPVADVRVTVFDDDEPSAQFARARAPALEGAPNAANVRVDLSSAPERAIEIGFRATGSASRGADYTIEGMDLNSGIGSVTVRPGQKSVSIPVTIRDDDIGSEGEESVVLTLEAGQGYSLGQGIVHTLVIEDNDGGVVVDHAGHPGPLQLSEGGAVGEYTLRLLSDPGATVFVSTHVTDPGAIQLTGVAVFSGGPGGNWREPQTVRVFPLQDDDDRDEEITITHTIASTSANYRDVVVAPVRVTVSDDDAAVASPVIAIRGGRAIVENGIAQFTLTATPAPVAAIAVTVDVAVEGEFADAGALGEKTVAIGRDGTAALTVGTHGDAVDEADGAIVATIVSGTGYTVATPPSHSARVAVRDDDDPPPPLPSVSFVGAASSAQEHVGVYSVDIVIDPPPDETLVVNYTVSGTATQDSDYTLHNINAVAVPAGAAGVRISVTLADDREAEDRETIVLDIAPGNGYTLAAGRSRHTLGIIDNDLSGVTVTPAGFELDEGMTRSYTVVLDTDPGAGARVTVTVAVSDPGTVAVSPNALTFDTNNWNVPQTVNVSAQGDDDDRDELVRIGHTVAGYGPAATAGAVTVTVLDDDVQTPVLSISGGGATIEEGAVAQFTLHATPPPLEPILVNVAIVSTGDFAETGQAGNRLVSVGVDGRGLFSVATENDAAEEAEGAIRAVIGAGDGYTVAPPPTHSAAVTVTDNDAPPAISTVVFDAAGATVEEPSMPAVHRVRVVLSPAAETSFPLRYRVTRDRAPGEDPDMQSGDCASGSFALRCTGRVAVTEGDAAVTIDVPIADDDVFFDPGRTVTVELLADNGYELGVIASHVLTIIDNDRAAGTLEQAQATMARLGRSLSEMWIEGVSERFAARRAGAALPGAPPGEEDDGFQFAIAGRTDWFDPEAGWRTSRDGWDAPPDLALDEALAATIPRRPSQGGGMLAGTPVGGGIPEVAAGFALAANMQDEPVGEPPPGAGDSGGGFRERLRNIFSSSSFEADGPEVGGGRLAFWGRGASASLEGGAEQFSLDADMTSAMLGMDWTGVWLTVGVMASHGSGDGRYRAGNIDGELELALSGITPYLNYELSERTSIWGAINASSGDLTLKPELGGELVTEAEMSTLALALGGRSEIFANAAGLSLSVLGDALSVTSETGDLAGLPGVEAASTRFRVALEGAWTRTLAGGSRIRARIEGGMRGDSGDAEEGLGAEIALGVAWVGSSGLVLELAGRSLVTHADESFRQNGVSVMATWDPRPETPLGPTLSMRRGTDASSRVDRLHAARSLAGLGAGGADTAREEIEFGWGLPWRDERYVLTPMMAVGSVGETRETSLGWRLEADKLERADLVTGFRATWSEQAGGRPDPGPRSDRTLELYARARW